MAVRSSPIQGHRAFARFRDHDGVSRKIERTGRSATAAQNRPRARTGDHPGVRRRLHSTRRPRRGWRVSAG